MIPKNTHRLVPPTFALLSLAILTLSFSAPPLPAAIIDPAHPSATIDLQAEGSQYQLTVSGTWGGATVSVTMADASGVFQPTEIVPFSQNGNLTQRIRATGKQLRFTLANATSTTALDARALRIPHGSGPTVDAEEIAEALGYTPPTGPDSIPWLAWIRADDYPSGAITTLAPRTGTTGNFVGTGTIVTNAINGHKAVSFNGSSNALVAGTGGAALSGDFYVGLILRHTSVSGHQDYLSWGEPEQYKRRSIHKYAISPADKITFIGESADVPNRGGTSLLANTNYFLEAFCKNGIIRLFVNGAEECGDKPNNSFSTYSSSTINIGRNPSGAEWFNGLLAEAFVAGIVPTPDQHRALRRHVTSTYGIPTADTTYSHSPRLSESLALSASPVTSTTNSTVIGPGNVILTGGTAGVLNGTTPAALSIYGSIAAYSAGAEHMLSNCFSGQNTLAIWNKSPGGYSATRFLDWEEGKEMAAFGYGRDSEPWGANGDGSSYWEVSNFRDASKFGQARIVQTRVGNGTYALRWELKENGDMVWYNRVHHTTKSERLKLEESTGNLILSNGTFSTKGIAAAITTKTSTYTAGAVDYTILADATTGQFDIDLPAAAANPNRIYVIKKVDSSGNTVSIDPNGSENIDGSSASLSLGVQNSGRTIQSTGTGWVVIGSFN